MRVNDADPISSPNMVGELSRGPLPPVAARLLARSY